MVEEKLDGANVALWWEGEWVACAGRSEPGVRDRTGQFGVLRSWAAEHVDRLQPLLHDGSVLYGEWLLLTHTVPYDRLPSYLFGIDIVAADGSFDAIDDRNERLDGAGVARPPELFRGVLGTIDVAESLLASTSAFGSSIVEGIIVRTVDGALPRVAKLVAPSFTVVADEEWLAGRPRNRLVGAAP